MTVVIKSAFLLRTFAVIAAIAGTFSYSSAQSTSQAAPTAVTTNEIRGSIPARDIGDSRLTNHFYLFNGNQGDVFVNVVTENLDGDIDIFIVDGLKPLTKITVFSDASSSETGRVVYLRQPEKLLLRIQGRSPNDEPATYRIKFAGSFVPLEAVAETESQKQPEVSDRDPGRVRVNSVGTIIEPAPQPVHKAEEEKVQLPAPVAMTVQPEQMPADETKNAAETADAEVDPNKDPGESPKAAVEDKADDMAADPDAGAARAKPLVIINEYPLPENVPEVIPEARTDEAKTTEKGEVIDPADNASANNPDVEPVAANSAEVGPVNPSKLTKIQLIITMKDGRIVKHQINDIFSFNVTQGILRVILNDGSITRYSLLDVEKVAIEEIGK